MSSPFYGIDLASKALRAFQRGLDVTGHNIANVNTRGYSRQLIDYSVGQATSGYGVHKFSLGEGVQIAGINRARDSFLDARLRTSESDLSRSDSMLASLRNIESVMNEPGTSGISSALNKFFDSWSGLASNPGDAAQRQQVQAAGQTLTSRIRNLYRDLEAQNTQATDTNTATFDQIDHLAAEISHLNSQIQEQSAAGNVPNDLLDSRDTAIADLNKIVAVQVTPTANNSVLVAISGYTLVDLSGTHAVIRNYDASTQSLVDPAGCTFALTGGSLTGQIAAIGKLKGVQSQLDGLANNLRTEVNVMHRTGLNNLGNTGVDFFNDAVPQTGARDFDLSVAVNADFNAIAAGITPNDGDGGLALSMSGLRDRKIASLGNQTFRTFYSQVVSGVGRDVAFFKGSAETQSAIVDQTNAQVQSVSGVSIDDEMANMLKFQRSYQAAAKALSVFDQMTEDLIGMLKR